MKKFVSVVLAAIALFNTSVTSFALSVKGLDPKRLYKIDSKMYGVKPISGDDTQAFIIGLVEVKVDPDALIQNKEVIISTKEEPLHYFNSLTKFFQKTPARKEVNKFELDGVRVTAPWYRFFERFYNWLFNVRLPIKYQILPISNDDANALRARKVSSGDLKSEAKDRVDLKKEIETKNGKGKAKQFCEKLLDKAFEGLNGAKGVDPFDPYNAAEKGTLIKYMDYYNTDSINYSDYYSRQEANERNKQITSKIREVCNKVAETSRDKFIEIGEIGVLSKEKSSLNFLIVVKDEEARKLSKILEVRGADFLSEDKSVIELRFRQQFKSTEFDDAMSDEMNDIVDSIKEQPGFWRWLEDSLISSLDKLGEFLPNFVTDWYRLFVLMPSRIISQFSSKPSSYAEKITKAENEVKLIESQLRRGEDTAKRLEEEFSSAQKRLEVRKIEKSETETSYENAKKEADKAKKERNPNKWKIRKATKTEAQMKNADANAKRRLDDAQKQRDNKKSILDNANKVIEQFNEDLTKAKNELSQLEQERDAAEAHEAEMVLKAK